MVNPFTKTMSAWRAGSFQNYCCPGKAPKARQTTDGGDVRLRLSEAKNPRDKWINKTKPRMGDRTHNLSNTTLHISLSSLRDYLCCCAITGGFTPVCGLSSLRDYRVSSCSVGFAIRP